MTTRGATALTDFTFAADDILIMGRESAGVPESVHAAIADRVVIPLAAGTRSLNMAMAAGIAAHEALRQTGGFRGIVSALK
jgi:tRNA (cytidine/uridine-2'-O-)-methyltransferase